MSDTCFLTGGRGYNDPHISFVDMRFRNSGNRLGLCGGLATNAFLVFATIYVNFSNLVDDPVAFVVFKRSNFLLFQNYCFANRAFFAGCQTFFTTCGRFSGNNFFGVRRSCNYGCFQVLFTGNALLVLGAYFTTACIFVNDPFGYFMCTGFRGIGMGVFGLF